MKSSTRILFALMVAGIVAGGVRAEEKKYTLKDLQALSQSKSWQELLPHLLDVSPSERSADWNKVVEVACIQPGRMEDYLAQYCLEPLNAVLATDPQNQAFAWKAGKWARVNLASWTAAPFFAHAIVKKGNPRCGDEDVTLAVVAGLSQNADGNKDVVSQSRTLAFETCWPATKDALLKAFNDGDSYFVANACSPLKQKDALSNLQSKLCTPNQ